MWGVAIMPGRSENPRNIDYLIFFAFLVVFKLLIDVVDRYLE